MADDYTELNPGSDGGFMDEEGITFGISPVVRKRPRVVIGGSTATELAEVLQNDPLGSEYGLVTRNIPSGEQKVNPLVLGDPICTYGITSGVASESETIVVSHTVSVGKTFHGIGITASGDVHARFIVYFNGVVKLVGRTSVALPTFIFYFDLAEPTADTGQDVEIKVIHYASGVSGEFEATLLGRED